LGVNTFFNSCSPCAAVEIQSYTEIGITDEGKRQGARRVVSASSEYCRDRFLHTTLPFSLELLDDYRIGRLFDNGGGAVIVGDNIERTSMPYYRQWAFLDNNEVFPLKLSVCH